MLGLQYSFTRHSARRGGRGGGVPSPRKLEFPKKIMLKTINNIEEMNTEHTHESCYVVVVKKKKTCITTRLQ